MAPPTQLDELTHARIAIRRCRAALPARAKENQRSGLSRSTSLPIHPDAKLSDVLHEFDRDMLRRVVCDLYRGQAVRLMQRVADAFGWERVADITRANAVEWLARLAEQGRAGSTTNDNLKKFVMFGKFLVQGGYVTTTPFGGIQRARVVSGPGMRPIALDEFRTLISWLGSRDTWQTRKRARYYTLAFLTGLRHNELRGLIVSDVQGVDLMIRASVSKSRKTQHVPLCAVTRELLAVQNRGKGPNDALFNPVPRRETLVLDCERAGIDTTGIGMHSLRNGYATALDQAGVPMGSVAKLLRHASPQISLTHYIRPDDRAKIEAVARVATAVCGDDETRSPPRPARTPGLGAVPAGVCD